MSGLAVREALCQLVGKCLCATVKEKAQHYFNTFQFEIACHFGAEKNGPQISGMY